MSLEELKDCNAEGIKESMDNAVSKMKFNFKQSEKEIGMCSDGAMVNRSVYNLLHDEFGEQYLCILCLSHKFELSMMRLAHLFWAIILKKIILKFIF